MEKLIIKKFGPINFVELELRTFNILIGENATGKSTVAKVLAVCRYFSYIVDVDTTLLESSFANGLDAWGLRDYLMSDSYIYYENDDYSISAEYTQQKVVEYIQENGGEIEVNYPVFTSKINPKSQEFSKLLEELNIILKHAPQDTYAKITNEFSIPVSFYQNNVSKVMNNPFYLFTERGLQSVFSLGRHSIQNISDSLFNQFARMDLISKSFKKSTEIPPLDIIYKNEGGRSYIKKNKEDKFLNLASAASGYQSTIPIVLLVKHYSEVRKKRKTFIIEEPELNLFPDVQNKLVEFLVEKCIYEINSQVLITTHSPYMLATINNLIYAYWVGLYKPEVKEVIEKKYWLNPDLVSAYRLTADGKSKNILDPVEKQIDVNELDKISHTIDSIWKKIEVIHDGPHAHPEQ